jgi:hypothetical protein
MRFNSAMRFSDFVYFARLGVALAKPGELSGSKGFVRRSKKATVKKKPEGSRPPVEPDPLLQKMHRGL